MCVPVHIDNARKCSEARRLKDFVQHKCSISDTRSLRCTPSLCLSKTQGFPSMFFPEQYQFQIKQPESPACETQTSPRDCWNERFVVIFIIFPPDNDLLLVSVFCKAGRGAQEEQIDEWRWIKVVVPWAQVHTVHALYVMGGEQWRGGNTDRRTGVAAVDERCCQVWKDR